MITNIVLVVSLVILLCVITEKFSYKIGVPALIFFMFIGMLFGSDGLMKIEYENFKQAEMICSIALIFTRQKKSFSPFHSLIVSSVTGIASTPLLW